MKILIVGGSGSGKSNFAEELAVAQSNKKRVYIATMEPFGEEGEARISRHREMRRERGFTTIERYTNLQSLALPPCGCALLEDIGNLVANEVFVVGGDTEAVTERIVAGVIHLAAQCETLVVVSNDILREAGTFDSEMQSYLQVVGRVNRQLAAKFDAVYEVAANVAERLR